MEICEVTIYTSIDDPEVDNKVVGIKIFDNPIEINKYVDSLKERKSIGFIDDYEIKPMTLDDIGIRKASFVMNSMSFEDFIKLMKELLKEPTVKTF